LTSAEVVAEGAETGRLGHTLHERLRSFEANDVPAQLALDLGDVVVDFRPWPFISSRPELSVVGIPSVVPVSR
jgi:hypothetical protein